MVMTCLGHSFSPSVPQRTPPGQEELLNGRLVYRTAWSCTVQRKMAPTKLLLGKSFSLRIESLLASEFIFYCLLFLLVKFPSFSGCSHYSNMFELFPLCTQELFFFPPNALPSFGQSLSVCLPPPLPWKRKSKVSRKDQNRF